MFASLVLKFVTQNEGGLLDVTLLYTNTGIIQVVSQYEKIEYNLLAFSRPLLNLFQHNERQKRENCDAASQSDLACNFPPILPNLPFLNVLVALFCAVL
jgi:hypothetical protein